MKTIIEAKQPMHSPSHPGEVLSSMYIEPMGASITEAAEALGVSRKHLSAIVNGSASVTPACSSPLTSRPTSAAPTSRSTAVVSPRSISTSPPCNRALTGAGLESDASSGRR